MRVRGFNVAFVFHTFKPFVLADMVQAVGSITQPQISRTQVKMCHKVVWESLDYFYQELDSVFQTARFFVGQRQEVNRFDIFGLAR